MVFHKKITFVSCCMCGAMFYLQGRCNSLPMTKTLHTESNNSSMPIFKQQAQLPEDVQAENKKLIIIEKTIGQKFIIELPANPTTGYSWYWLINESFDQLPVKLSRAEYVAEKTGLVGSGGVMKFTFDAHKAGSTSLVVVYKRRWENTDLDRREYEINVK